MLSMQCGLGGPLAYGTVLVAGHQLLMKIWMRAMRAYASIKKMCG